MHSDNRPPTLHGEDRTHTATDTQRHLSLHPGPCGGGQAVGQEPATGGGFFLWWDISAASQGRRPSNEAPTISCRSQADKCEPGQQPVPNPMVKRASQPPTQGRSSSDHQREAGVPVSSGTALRATMGSKGTVSSF